MVVPAGIPAGSVSAGGKTKPAGGGTVALKPKNRLEFPEIFAGLVRVMVVADVTLAILVPAWMPTPMTGSPGVVPTAPKRWIVVASPVTDVVPCSVPVKL